MKIAPSILSANFTKLGEEIIALDKAGADVIHIDVMDGHFVPNLTFGAGIIKQIRPLTKKIFDVHLMVKNPTDFVLPFKDAGADILTFHAEAVDHHDRLISYIKEQGMKAGMALNPSTHESILEYVAHKLDLILVMSVNPGFGGQKFLDSQVAKVKAIKEKYVKDSATEIEIDGGVDFNNAKALKDAGATILVAGTTVFKDGLYEQNIKKLKV
jgi:ribulose-phosphate 3-epimerase